MRVRSNPKLNFQVRKGREQAARKNEERMQARFLERARSVRPCVSVPAAPPVLNVPPVSAVLLGALGALDERRVSLRQKLILCTLIGLTLPVASQGIVWELGPVLWPVGQPHPPAHDPFIFKHSQDYFLFATGGTLGVRRSSDRMSTWHNTENIFSEIPDWITKALGRNITDLWAPDLSYFGGQYHLYYAGSIFGTSNSVIGLVTTPTLDSSDPNHHWTDRGLILQSFPNSEFNAIDPSIAFDEQGQPWMSYGSFKSGIKVAPIDPSTGQISGEPTAIAARIEQAIEAPGIIYQAPYFYLFTSFDKCCEGVNSTYNIRVGRALAISGPYVDRFGLPMMQGGGTKIMGSHDSHIGPGGQSFFKDGSEWNMAFHYYDANDNGAAKLDVKKLTWDSQKWPKRREGDSNPR